MSKERARRRAEREAAQEREAPARAVRPRRAATRRPSGPGGRTRKRSRPDSLLRRRRRRQDLALVAVLLLLNALLWTQVPGWPLRLAALGLSLLLWPLLVIVVFDRRPSS